MSTLFLCVGSGVIAWLWGWCVGAHKGYNQAMVEFGNLPSEILNQIAKHKRDNP